MEILFDILSNKRVVSIFFVFVVIREIRAGFLKDFKAYFRSIRWSAYRNILITAVVFVGGLLLIDEPLIRLIQKIETPWVLNVIAWAATWGRGQNTWGLLLVLYALASWIFRAAYLKRLIFGCILSGMFSGLLGQILKYLFMRARPFIELGPYHFFDWQGLIEHGSKFRSFPSGDVAVAAGTASFLLLAVKNPVRWVFPFLALFICTSRMILNRHWPSDVAFSFIISFAMARFVLDYLKFSNLANRE